MCVWASDAGGVFGKGFTKCPRGNEQTLAGHWEWDLVVI